MSVLLLVTSFERCSVNSNCEVKCVTGNENMGLAKTPYRPVMVLPVFGLGNKSSNPEMCSSFDARNSVFTK